MNENLKKWLPWIAVAVVAVIVIAVIGLSGDEGEEEAASTTTEAAMVDPTPGALGAVVVAPGEEIQIRSLQVLSGANAGLGIPNMRGTEIAISDFGDIAGFTVNMGTPLDDLCSAEGGQAAGQVIVADESIVGTIGTSCSGAAVPASTLVSESGGVLISPSNTSPALTSDLAGTAGDTYNPGYYRTAHNDLYQGAAVAKFVFEDLGLTKVAAIHDGDPYTQGLAQAFADAFVAAGGEVVVFTAVNKGDTDMTGVLTEVATAGPEAVFFPIFQPEGDFIVQQAADIEAYDSITLIAADGLLVDAFMSLEESEGVYFSGPNLNYGTNQSETGQTSEGFLAAYEAAYGELPSASFWAHSYDATVMLLTSIEQVAVVQSDGSLFIDRLALRESLTATSGFGGIIGTLGCDAFGDCGAQRISVVLHTDSTDVEAGKRNTVFEFSAF